MLIFIVIQFKLVLHQMNVDNAYLLDNLLKEIYLKVPKKLISKGPNKALLLQKGLYGLKQSDRVWNQKLFKFLAFMGFQPTFSDSCVFVNAKKHLIIVFYVNDLLVIDKTEETIKSLKQEIMKTYKMKNMDLTKVILDIQVQIRLNQNTIILNQTSYLRNFLQKLGINSNIKKTQFMHDYNALIPSESHEK